MGKAFQENHVYYSTGGGSLVYGGSDVWVNNWLREVAPKLNHPSKLLIHRRNPDKKVEFDNAMFGTIGLESAFGALSTILEAEKVIEMLTAGKNRFGIPSEPIAENAKADLSLFVPGEEYVFGRQHIYSTSKNSIFLNKTLKGKVIGIITENSYQINE